MNTNRISFMKEEYRGMSSMPEYQAWRRMIREHHIRGDLVLCVVNPIAEDESRVFRTRNTVCPEWVNDFGRFLDDMGRRPTVFHVLWIREGETEWNRENVVWKFRPPTSPIRKRMFVEQMLKYVFKMSPEVIAQIMEPKTLNLCHDEMLDSLHGVSCDCDRNIAA